MVLLFMAVFWFLVAGFGLQLHGLHGLQLHGLHGLQLDGFHGLHGGTLHGLHLAVALHGHGYTAQFGGCLGRLVAKAGHLGH